MSKKTTRIALSLDSYEGRQTSLNIKISTALDTRLKAARAHGRENNVRVNISKEVDSFLEKWISMYEAEMNVDLLEWVEKKKVD